MKANFQDPQNCDKNKPADFKSYGERLCSSCAFDNCGCSVQDSIFRCDDIDGREQSDLSTFGCNKYEAKITKFKTDRINPWFPKSIYNNMDEQSFKDQYQSVFTPKDNEK